MKEEVKTVRSSGIAAMSNGEFYGYSRMNGESFGPIEDAYLMDMNSALNPTHFTNLDNPLQERLRDATLVKVLKTTVFIIEGV